MKRIQRINIALLVLVVFLTAVIVAQAAQVYGTKVARQKWTSDTMRRYVWTLRTDTALTGSYVETGEADIGGRIEAGSFPDVQLVFDITQGSMTEFKYIVWSGTYVDTDGDALNAPDTWLWARECTETVAASAITDTLHEYKITISGDIAYYKPLPIYGERIKVQVKRSAGTGGSVAVYLVGVY